MYTYYIPHSTLNITALRASQLLLPSLGSSAVSRMSKLGAAAPPERHPAPPPAPHRNHAAAPLPFPQPRPAPANRSLLHALCDLRPDARSRFVSSLLLLPHPHPQPSQHLPPQSHVNDSSNRSRSTATDVYGIIEAHPHPLAALRLTCRAARDQLVDPFMPTPCRLVWDQADYQQQQQRQHGPARSIPDASTSSWATAAGPAKAYAATNDARDGAGTGLGQQLLPSGPSGRSSLIKERGGASSGSKRCRSWREAVQGVLRAVATRRPCCRELTLHALGGCAVLNQPASNHKDRNVLAYLVSSCLVPGSVRVPCVPPARADDQLTHRPFA